MTVHPYCYPGTEVYRNKEGIRDQEELTALERQLSAIRLETLPTENISISPEGYSAIHHHLLQDLYDWAGQYRNVNTGRGAPFCKAEFIETDLRKRFARLLEESNLGGLDADLFAARAAEHLNELNAIHPFLDGNGRTQRAFLEVLADQAGHKVDLARINPDAWNQASIAGFYRQDHELMRRVIVGTIDTGSQIETP